MRYEIGTITYSMNDLAAILRMFGGCMPLGCSYETETEQGYFNRKLNNQRFAETIVSRLDPETINQIMQQKGAGEGVDEQR